MKEPSRDSIRRVLDLLDSYFIIKREQEKKGEIPEGSLQIWEDEIRATVEYLNWLAYRNESWYQKTYHSANI